MLASASIRVANMVSRSNRRCRQCEQGANVVKAAAAAETKRIKSATPVPALLSTASESRLLWRHVLYALGSLVGMLEGYASLQIPGGTPTHIHTLIRRLAAVARKLEEQNANQTPPQ